jgi:hypothetical protein
LLFQKLSKRSDCRSPENDFSGGFYVITLFDDPKAGASARRDRLSQVDLKTLVKLMTQQGNLTEEQVDRHPAQSRSNRTKQP